MHRVESLFPNMETSITYNSNLKKKYVSFSIKVKKNSKNKQTNWKTETDTFGRYNPAVVTAECMVINNLSAILFFIRHFEHGHFGKTNARVIILSSDTWNGLAIENN